MRNAFNRDHYRIIVSYRYRDNFDLSYRLSIGNSIWHIVTALIATLSHFTQNQRRLQLGSDTMCSYMSAGMFRQSVHFQVSAVWHRSHCRALTSSVITTPHSEHEIRDDCLAALFLLGGCAGEAMASLLVTVEFLFVRWILLGWRFPLTIV